MPKKSVTIRFPILPDIMCGISPNKDTLSVDVTEFIHSGKTCWGLIFDYVKHNCLAYYIFVSKDPTTSSTLDVFGQFISDHRIPRQLIMDIHIISVAGNQWNQVLRRTFTPLFLSVPDKHN